MQEKEKHIDFFKFSKKKKAFLSERTMCNILIWGIPTLFFARFLIGEMFIEPTEHFSNEANTFITQSANVSNPGSLKQPSEQTEETYFPDSQVHYKNVPLVDSFEGFVKNKGYSPEYMKNLNEQEIKLASTYITDNKNNTTNNTKKVNNLINIE